MEDFSFDGLEDSLIASDLTNKNFIDDEDELDVSMSPCVLSSSSSRINTNTLPRSLSTEELDDSDAFEIPTKSKKSLSLPREVYLITYSQADVVKATDRAKFAELICSEFNRSDSVVDKWVCSAEIHREGGFHYHLAIKLHKQRRWAQVRNNIKRQHGIDLDFQGWHDNYYSAYTYVTKYDPHFLTSPGHPTLDNPPSTSKATASKRHLALDIQAEIPKQSAPKKQFKPPRLTSDAVAEIIRVNNLKTKKTLYAFAKSQAKEGKKDLLKYLYNRPNKRLHADLVSTVWSIEDAEAEIDRKHKTRLEILSEFLSEPCAVDEEGRRCEGSWYKAALETLSKNDIAVDRFSTLVKANLKYGRGKGRNLMICGPTNCAKSFLFLPLTKVYKCFTTPAKGSYNWVLAPDKEIIFLNDMRYDIDGETRLMPWNMFLNLLEGVTVNISMPKNFYENDFPWVERQPIFATSDKPIMRIRNGQLDVGETQQMDQRWTVLHFHHQYVGDDVDLNLIPCGACFAKLILGQ